MGVWAPGLDIGQGSIRTDGFVCLTSSLNHFLSLFEHFLGGLLGFVQNISAGGLDRNAILDAAFDMLSRDGEVAFSVRKLGVHIGVDPMTVLHHFGSKDELLRQIADQALATVKLPLPSADWRADLRNVAAAYRDLAHRHPRFRFHATGPADHASSEVVYRALRRAGLPDTETAGLGLAFYAFILGYTLAEAEGLLRPISDEDEVELRSLDPLACPSTLALIPAFKALDRDAAFDASVNAFIDGLSC